MRAAAAALEPRSGGAAAVEGPWRRDVRRSTIFPPPFQDAVSACSRNYEEELP